MDKYYSQIRQDEFLNKVIFNNKKNGYFIDIGAHDGHTFNNSLFFEQNNNWKGICVEPNPNVFNKLNLSRKSTNLNVCVGNSNKTVKFTVIEGYAEMLSGISEKYDERHFQRIENNIKNKGGSKKEIELEMIRLDSIVELNDKKIDFVSIDTEGNEFDIISSINFNKLDITAIVVENNYNDDKINKYLLELDYIKIIKLDFDEVYLHKKYITIGIQLRVIIWNFNLIINKVFKKLKLK